MKDLYFFSCENVVIISSKGLIHYPEIEKYIYTYLKPVKSILFFIVAEPSVTKYTFNQSNPVAFANVIVETGDNIKIAPILAVDNNIKHRLIEYIINFFIKPITIQIDLNNKKWLDEVTFLSSIGFGNPQADPNHSRLINMTLVPQPNQALIINQAISIAQTSPFLCNVKVFFPKSLANTLASYLSEQIEVGGKICITRYIKDSNRDDVAVLGFNTAEAVPGDKTNFVVNIPPDKVSPFSFHTHPDVCYTKLGCFLGWPSGPDLRFTVYYYLHNKDILAHFVISSEGIWVIHLRPPFQRLLFELKNKPNTQDCQDKIQNFVLQSFALLEGNRKYELISPEDRLKTRKKFIEVSKNLKISDFKGTELEAACATFVKEDAVLFDVDLIKWSAFESNKAFLSFSYIFDPAGGLPCTLPVDCSVLAPMLIGS
jgi:hypothetical protein